MKTLILILIVLSSNMVFGQWNLSGFTAPADFHEVDFPSENAAYILGNPGLVYKSTDGGITWFQLYNFGPFTNPSDIQFINADTGFVNLDGNQYRTVDGGSSWTQFGTFPKVEIFQNNLFTSYTSNDTTYIKKSTDLGNSWTTLFQNYQTGNQPYILAIVNNLNAYFINPNELDRVYKTTDSFSSIDTLFITNGNLVLQEEFDFKDLTNGYLYGSWGSQSHPTRTWNTGTFYFPINLDGFGVLPVLDLDFNTSKLYASSLYGKIFFSVNNGQNWTEQTTPINGPIYSISFFNDNKGIAVGGNKILYTTNGGTLGISEIQNETFPIKIYPNPTLGKIIIQNNSMQPLRFKLYSSTGKILIDRILTNKNVNIDVSSYSNGVYFYNLISKNNFVKKGKLVKK